MMTLDEAIRHCEEVADRCAVTDGDLKCEMQHRQLAEWLKELKAYKEQSGDAISRQAAIDAINSHFGFNIEEEYGSAVQEVINGLPSAQPERLTDDDFETIRILLNAYKEKLGNQQRWKEAMEYQRIIDRFMAFASAQPERHTEEYSKRLLLNIHHTIHI